MWHRYPSAVFSCVLLVLGSPTCPVLNLPYLLAFAASSGNHCAGMVQTEDFFPKLCLGMFCLNYGWIW